MAISTAVYGKTQFRCAIAAESTFGLAKTAGFQELHITEPPTLDTATTFIRDATPRLDGSSILDKDDVYTTTAGAITTVTVSGILTLPVLHLLLEGVFQNKTTSTNEDSYKWNASTEPPYAQADQTFFTVALHSPITARGKRLTSAFLKTLEITWDAGSNGGRASFSATFISGLECEMDITHSPNLWSSPGTSYFTTSQLDTKTYYGGDLVVSNFSFTLDNGATFYGVDSDGFAEGCAVGAAGGKGYSATGSISAKYDSNTMYFPGLSQAGTGSAFSFIFDTGDTDHQLEITGYSVIDSANNNFGGDAGAMIDVAFTCVSETAYQTISFTLGSN